MIRSLASLLLTVPCALLAWTSCASSPTLPDHVQVREADRVRIRFEQPKTRLVQTLVSRTVQDPAALYSASNGDQLTKVADQEQVSFLVNAFAEQAFFERAYDRSLPQAFATLTVDINGRELIWSNTATTAQADRARFQACQQMFLEVFNSITAYHTSTGDNRVLEEHRRQEALRAKKLREAGKR